MADFRTKAVTPATISYTPLDLSRVQTRLGQKVQEIEGAAAAGNTLMSQLDFKDGYMNPGLAKHKQAQYSDRIKSLVDGLYTTGDTRTFTSDLSLLANQINTDEEIQGGLKDYELSKLYDTYNMDPTKKGLYYGFTDDNTSQGNVISNDWRKNPPTPDSVKSFFGQIYPGENLYDDYKEGMGDLNSLKAEEFLGYNEYGHLAIKTVKEPSELPQSVRDVQAAGGSHYQAVAARLKEVNFDYYNELANDYDRGGTDSAINFKARGIDRETFIGEVILENLTKLQDTTLSYENPPAGGGGNTPDAPKEVGLQSTAIATVIERGFGSAALNATGLTSEAIAETFDMGEGDALGKIEILSNPTDPKNKEKLEVLAFETSVINNWLQNGDPERPDLGAGNQAKAAHDERTAEILKTTDRNGASFESQFAKEIAETGLTSTEYFHKIRQTQRLLGKLTTKDMYEDREAIMEVYDGYTNDPALEQQLTFGIGYFTKPELEGYLNRLEETAVVTGSYVLGGTSYHFPGDHAMERYNYESDRITLTNSQGEKSTMKWRQGQKNAPFVNREELLPQIMKDNPLAFYEMARVDIMNRSSLFHTDVLIEGRQIANKEVFPPALGNMARSSTFTMDPASQLYPNWDLQVFQTSEKGGTGGTKESGYRAERMTKVKGEPTISSPYVDLEWSSDEAKTFLTDFINFGNKANLEKGKYDEFVFNGMIIPNGQTSEAGLMITRIDGTGKKTGDATTFVLTPKNLDTIENNALFQQIQTARVKLTGKEYLPRVMTGPAYKGQYGLDLAERIKKEVDLYGVEAGYSTENTLEKLAGTKYFNPQEKIADTSIDNPYFTGSTSVVADIQGGQEVYRLRRKDGTGDVTWAQYLEKFGDPSKDLSNTFLGVTDYKDFLISVYMNRNQLNNNLKANNKKEITGEAIQSLLVGSTDGKFTMQSLQGIVNTLGVDWGDLTNVPITFVNSMEAFHHFSGQSGRSGPDSFGNPRSGYSVK